MSFARLFLASVLLLGAAGTGAPVRAEEGDVAWVSYRDAYRHMLRFEKYGKPKQLIQNHLQVVPLERGASMDGLHLFLEGRATQLELPLDAVGRAVLPLSKASYDENARLALNRRAGQFGFQSRVSIVPRADGVYEAADLRAACEQALGFLRDTGQLGAREAKCAGVVFAYPKNGAEPSVRFRAGDAGTRLKAEDGGAFLDDSTVTFRTVVYQFADWPERGQVVTQTPPAAIGAVIR